MHPQLFSFPLPQWFLEKFGPLSAMFSIWHLFAGVFIVSLLFFLSQATYDTEEEGQEKANPRILWGSLAFLLPSGAVLASFALARGKTFGINAYGFMLAIAFMSGIFLSMREARRVGESSDQIVEIVFYLIIGGLVGARIFNTVVEWKQYQADWFKIQKWYQWKLFRVWEGGLVFYGGLLTALLVFFLYTRRHKLNAWKLADIIVPTVALGQFFGRLGCYAAGCCYGKVNQVSWAVQFPKPHPMAGSWVHPTQLYEATACLLIFLVLLFLRPRKQFHGQLVAAYLAMYALVRFTIEMFRGDTIRGFLFKVDFFKPLSGAELLSTSQLIALLTFGLSLAFFFRKRTTEE